MIQNPQTKYQAFAPLKLKDRTWPDQVIDKAPRWLSSDLRDGNQALIEPMNIEQKLRMFDLLIECGFKEIEVAFPSASDTEFTFVRRLIEENRIPEDVTIQVLTQSREDLVVRTFEALKGCKQAIVHIYNATSPTFRRVVFNKTKEEVKALAVFGMSLAVEEAKKYPETDWTFEYSPEIFTDTEMEFAVEVCEAVVAVVKPTPEKPVIFNLPATVEVATPNVYADQIEYFCRNISCRDSVIVSLHTHNDRGCAVAATELGLMAGGDRVEGCLFGHGERTGNVDLITMALNMYTQGLDPKLNFSQINKVVREVEYCTAIKVHPRHPYAGELVFTAFSGSHQDAIRKGLSDIKNNPDQMWKVPYLPIDPIDVGRSYEAVIRVNSQSGKGGISYLLEEDHGINMPRRLQIEFSRVVQNEADGKGIEVTSPMIFDLFNREFLNKGSVSIEQPINIVEDESGHTEITVAIHTPIQKCAAKGQGNGPIAALVNALNTTLNINVDVVSYHEHARSQGSKAEAVAFVEMQVEAKTLFGVAIHANTARASIDAVISALNRAIAKGLVEVK
ncbi:2-isopropylmalate synthase [Wohlfahrtiimonas populi]|uniref:2-isopropylmalate synthase n=1 Tax=Wohlfahrtiimonas populi TaxID=1940240 RepID=UPI00098D7257|nr:2-isopropylmalate synthase [Wohlfahrtiimonas populi]